MTVSDNNKTSTLAFGQHLTWRGGPVVTARGETIQPGAAVVFLNPGRRSDLAVCACPPDASLDGPPEAPLVLLPFAELEATPLGGWDGVTLTPELLRALLLHPDIATVARGVVEEAPELVRPLLPAEVFAFFGGLLGE